MWVTKITVRFYSEIYTINFHLAVGQVPRRCSTWVVRIRSLIRLAEWATPNPPWTLWSTCQGVGGWEKLSTSGTNAISYITIKRWACKQIGDTSIWHSSVIVSSVKWIDCWFVASLGVSHVQSDQSALTLKRVHILRLSSKLCWWGRNVSPQQQGLSL